MKLGQQRFSIQLFKDMASWADASTVIVTAPRQVAEEPHGLNASSVDFNVLMLKRSAKSSFYANTYVFPGGKIDQADCSARWIEVYKSIDDRFIKFFEKLKIKQKDKKRSPMFLQCSDDTLLREVSYRICAIRETFEETGILLTRSGNSDITDNTNARLMSPYEFKSLDEAQLWRKRVHQDASQFINLCEEFRCVPDIWSLYEWCNWLTPSEMFMKVSRRYDTVFYTVALSSIPKHTQQDDKETTHLILNTAEEILGAFNEEKILLGPPQIYELSRLLKFHKHDQFVKFTTERGLKGMSRWLPIRCNTTDGSLTALYPGDQFYPEETVASGDSSVVDLPMTYDEMLQIEPKHHNHMHYRIFDAHMRCQLKISYNPLYGHIPPDSARFRVKSSTFPKL